MTRSPFALALGADFDRLGACVRRHLGQPEGRSLLAGGVRRAWRRGGPLGWLIARVLRLEGAVAPAERFELRNELLPGSAMLWQRTLRGRSASGVVRWDARRRALVDALGRRRAIEVELVPSVEGAALVLSSRRQWLRVMGLRIPLPRALVGSACARESEGVSGIVLRLVVRHPLLGEYAGYEVELS